MLRPYTIARLAAAAGVHVETIRYYQRLELIPEPPKPAGGIRRYSQADVELLRFIKRAQGMGFTLAEVTDLLALRARRSCRATRELAATKLTLIETRLRELHALHDELANLIAGCDANTGDSQCPLIQHLAS